MTKCLDTLDKWGIPYNYTSDLDTVCFDEPHIDGITFRPYQSELINTALEVGRGVIKAPTGSGKSIIILGIMSAFSEENILFLVHTTDLVYQMKADLDKFGFDSGIWTGKDKEMGRITVATVQAYRKIAREYTTHWDVIFTDECFHEDTIISTKVGEEKIADIIPGELIKTNTGFEKVKRIFKNKVPLERVCKLTLSNGKTITCSIDHKFYSNGKWIKAADLLGKRLTPE